MYDWAIWIMITLAISLLVAGLIYLTWFLVHVSAGTRYSRAKSFIAVPIIALLLAFSIHFFLLWFGAGL